VSVGAFHRNLRSRGKGAKDWSNSFTEHEYLGKDEKGRHNFGVNLSVGHRVFRDKADGRWKKHKLTDERPAKDYVLVQGAKCCVEVYPYYAKYFDVDHEEVRLHEERWVVQRLFKEPDTWRDVGAWDPVMVVEEGVDFIKVAVTYETDYGPFTVEYFQRDGRALKHNISFMNESGGSETFRVIQRWAGIVGEKCNGKNVPMVFSPPTDTSLAFHRADQPKRKFTIAENLSSMVFNPDGSVKTEHCLQGPFWVESHVRGLKCDFCYGDWVLAQGDGLEIDPATATLDDPTEDGYLSKGGDSSANCNADAPVRDSASASCRYGGVDAFINSYAHRSYVEWAINSLFGGTLTANPKFKYNGLGDDGSFGEINPLTEEQPSDGGCTDLELWGYCASGVAYVDPFNIVVGINQEQDLGAAAKTALQAAIDASQIWFALGFTSEGDECPEPDVGANYYDVFSSEEGTPSSETILPDGIGDLTNIAENNWAAHEHWESVAEQTNEHYIWSGAAAFERDLYTFVNPTEVPGVGISKIEVRAFIRKVADGDSTQNNYELLVEPFGGAVDSQEGATDSEGFNLVTATWANNPETGNPWTWAEVNALQVGVGLRRGQAADPTHFTYCARLRVDVYTASTPPPTLYVEYTPAGWQGKISGIVNPAKIMGIPVADIAKVKGIA